MNVAQHDANGSDPAVPLYHQLALRLESAIQSGAIVPGQELGNEIRLAVRFGVSRPTMRRAILELVDKGLLVRKRGVGTHVVNSLSTDRRANDPRISRELRLSSLFDDLTAQGQQPTTVVLTQEMIRPPQAVVEMLNLPPGRPAMHLLRLRNANNRPLAILETYLPADLGDFASFDPSTTGLYQLLRGWGMSLRVARQRIGARAGTDEECRLLNEPVDSPILTMDRLTHDHTGRVVEVAQHVYRASILEYTMTLVDRWPNEHPV